MKVNFKKMILKDIEGKEVTADFSKQIGNMLYMQGQNIEECELGKRIYFAENEVEISEKEGDMVRRITAGYSFIVRQKIEEMLKS